MNRLKKKAVGDLCSDFVGIVGTILAFTYLTYSGVLAGNPIRFLLAILVGAFSGGIAAYCKVRNINKALYAKYDERELLLINRAYGWFTVAFLSYLMLITVIVVMAFGGKGTLAVWKLPVILLSGLFLSQCVASFYLFRCAKEDDDEIEGGAA